MQSPKLIKVAVNVSDRLGFDYVFGWSEINIRQTNSAMQECDIFRQKVIWLYTKIIVHWKSSGKLKQTPLTFYKLTLVNIRWNPLNKNEMWFNEINSLPRSTFLIVLIFIIDFDEDYVKFKIYLIVYHIFDCFANTV